MLLCIGKSAFGRSHAVRANTGLLGSRFGWRHCARLARSHTHWKAPARWPTRLLHTNTNTNTNTLSHTHKASRAKTHKRAQRPVTRIMTGRLASEHGTNFSPFRVRSAAWRTLSGKTGVEHSTQNSLRCVFLERSLSFKAQL